MLLGGASDSAAVVHWLSKAPFRLPFNEPTGDYAIVEQKAGGAYMAGVQGAMHFLTSADGLRGLRQRIGGKFPAAYLVIVRTSQNKMLPWRCHYETHMVMEP